MTNNLVKPIIFGTELLFVTWRMPLLCYVLIAIGPRYRRHPVEMEFSLPRPSPSPSRGHTYLYFLRAASVDNSSHGSFGSSRPNRRSILSTIHPSKCQTTAAAAPHWKKAAIFVISCRLLTNRNSHARFTWFYVNYPDTFRDH